MSATPDQVCKILDTGSKAYVGVAGDAHIVGTGPFEIIGSNKPALWLLGIPAGS